MLASVFLNDYVGDTKNSAASKTAGIHTTHDKRFDTYLPARNTWDEASAANRQTANTKQPVKNEPKAKENLMEKTEVENRERPKETVATEKTASVDDKKGTDDLQKTVSAAEKKIVQTVADICDVSPEIVMQWLMAMHMQPLQLTDPQAANQFLQMVLDVQDPALLLKMPTFQSMLQAINTQLQQFRPLANAAQSVQSAAGMLDGLQATIDEANNLVVTEVPDALQEADETSRHLPKPAQAVSTSSMGAALQNTTNARTDALQNVVLHEQELGVPQANALLTGTPERGVVTESVARLTQPASVDATDIMNQIMNRVRVQSGEGFAEIKVTLRPESLGDVTLKVATQNGIVTAQFIAENQRIKEVIEANFSRLKDMLQQQGVQVSELSVSVRQENQNEQMNHFLRAQQGSRSRMQRIAGVLSVETEEEPAPADMPNGYDNTVDYRV